MKTELISLVKDRSDSPTLAVCYAGGGKFVREGNFWRVEVGRRTLVHRSLCAVRHFGKRCDLCPNSQVRLVLKAQDPDYE